MKRKLIPSLVILFFLLSGCAALLPKGQTPISGFTLESVKTELRETQGQYADLQIKLVMNKAKISAENWQKIIEFDRKFVMVNNGLNQTVRLWERFGRQPMDLGQRFADLWDSWFSLSDLARNLLTEFK